MQKIGMEFEKNFMHSSSARRASAERDMYSIRYNCNRLLKPLYREDSDKKVKKIPPFNKFTSNYCENTAGLSISLPQVNYRPEPMMCRGLSGSSTARAFTNIVKALSVL